MIERSVPLGFRVRTAVITSAFCMGETRQQITDLHDTAMSRKSFRHSGLSAWYSAFPSTTSPIGFSFPTASPNSTRYFITASLTKSNVGCFNSISLMSGVNRLHDRPMLMAVSILSPVSTHTFMPAFKSVAIHSGTPAWRRSSMALAPRRMRSFSISSFTAAIYKDSGKNQTNWKIFAGQSSNQPASRMMEWNAINQAINRDDESIKWEPTLTMY